MNAWRGTYAAYKDVHDPEQHALENMILDGKWANMSNISSHTRVHTYPQCFNGSSLSVHFPGGMKYSIGQFSDSMRNESSSAGFKIKYY